MHIDPKSKIAGFPAMKVRSLIRSLSEWPWKVDRLREEMGISRKRAEKLLSELLDLGYVTQSDITKEPPGYKVSTEGRALAMASAAKPFTRETAERNLAGFLERVRQVNASAEYIYWVSKVIVFGSYLAGAKLLNDIDLAVKLTRRFEDPDEHMRANNHRLSVAYGAGKRVDNFSEQLSWGWIEVRLFLKSHSRVFSIHETEELEALKCPRKIIYSDGHDSISRDKAE